MSGFVAVFDSSHGLLGEPGMARVLRTLAPRGDRSEIERGPDAVMAVARFDWELDDGFAGRALIARDGGITVAADASLYYRDDLLRALAAANVRPAASATPYLIAAAYRAWGTDCAQHLEGDYAFVIHDRERHQVFAARDFMGRRPLYYAELGGALFVASTVSAIVAHPKVPRDLDDVALAEIVGVSLAGHERTPYRSVRALPPASWLTYHAASPGVRTGSHWSLRVEDDRADESFDAAAERLSQMLSDAIIERRALRGPTTIWLSGGYDSPVMFGVGNAAFDRRGYDRLAPISFSYPVGDPGREDELIEEIAEFWSARPVWLSIADVPMLADAREHAARADIPFQHAFENWLRALLGATARQRSRVALYGDGGDQLFAVSTIFLRDLFSDLRWRELRREWRAHGGAGVRALWNAVARPELSDRVARARGRTNAETALPDWLNQEFITQHSLDARQAEAEAKLASGTGGHAAVETRRSLGNPTIPRVLAGISSLGLEHGVEPRAPLLDRRIVEFALARPRRERASDGAVKHLLRHAARNVLPPSVLAPRPVKTGVLTDYFARSFRADPDGIVTDAFAHSILADRGIVDGAAMQQTWREYKSRGAGPGGHLFVAFQAEMWLQARCTVPAASHEAHDKNIEMPAAGFML